MNCISCHIKLEPRPHHTSSVNNNYVCVDCRAVYYTKLSLISPPFEEVYLVCFKWQVYQEHYSMYVSLTSQTYSILKGLHSIYRSSKLDWAFPHITPPIIKQLHNLTVFL